MTRAADSKLQDIVEALKSALGANLYSCCVYGSVVRGNAVPGVSDLNLLVILNDSTAEAHEAVAHALVPYPQTDPFILGWPGFERSVRAFAVKFASIRRNYRVMHGADPLAELVFDADRERFLCEQALRNLRLRLVFSYVTRGRHKAYDRFVCRQVTPFLVHVSEALRLEGVSIPADFAARIPILAREFGVDAGVLGEWLELKRAPRRFSDKETVAFHRRVFPVLDAVLAWIERRWKS